ncbi:DUF1003 domain-containing protein [Carnobacterium maltaromaticum]|uniref:DUF1003 domain-containing protein n=1 Tax=Carnobacterium maltaromaticum TaxID=2751 RepID=UPI00295F51FF|nr:DUF1003 domain-containing protein [Carnobacterium maltaromaticum]
MVKSNDTCEICNKNLVSSIQLSEIEPEIKKMLLEDYPTLSEESFIDFSHVMTYRLKYIKRVISSDSKEMDVLNNTVIESIESGKAISKNTNIQSKLTLGQKTADSIAKFGGSWPFIFIFMTVLIIWIIINSVALFSKPFDPYPFILLNLVLSCLAAIQAPVIMMSQNRQAERDRIQSTNDYQTNLKAEIEIRLLQQKMDHLLTNEWQHLVEIQTIQLDLLGELQKQINNIEMSH